MIIFNVMQIYGWLVTVMLAGGGMHWTHVQPHPIGLSKKRKSRKSSPSVLLRGLFAGKYVSSVL